VEDREFVQIWQLSTLDQTFHSDAKVAIMFSLYVEDFAGACLLAPSMEGCALIRTRIARQGRTATK
jgi:hypothetical protein